MRRDVRLEVAWIPEFADQFAEAVHQEGHVVPSCRPFNLLLVVLRTQEKVAKWTNVAQQLEDHVAVVIRLQ